MSRPSSMLYTAPGTTKQLSLTEELEKLEQSITLTLQEIDHNFNRCHRIVTHSILPIIDRFSEESSKVQEGSMFWKSFFERSANVSVGVYESHAEDEETTEMTATTEEETFTQSHYNDDSSPTTYNKTRGSVQQDIEHASTLDLEDESILHSMNLNADYQAQSTPRPQKPKSKYVQAEGETKWANMKSPYEKEFQLNHSSIYNQKDPAENIDDSEDATSTFSLPSVAHRKYNLTEDGSSHQEPPTTPESIRRRPGHAHQSHTRMLADTPDSSPYQPPPQHQQEQPSPSTTRRSKNDILLHRAVDTNWRLQATPLNTGSRSKPTTPKTALQQAQNNGHDYDSSPFSPAPPQMTTVFSPVATFKSKMDSNSNVNATNNPRNPKTPASTHRRRTPAGKPTAPSITNINIKKYDYDDDDDDIDFEGLGFSPPVTMQFSVPPSKLLQTPAREASKKMVRDILQSAGVRDDATSSTLDSPSVLMNEDLSDEF